MELAVALLIQAQFMIHHLIKHIDHECSMQPYCYNIPKISSHSISNPIHEINNKLIEWMEQQLIELSERNHLDWFAIISYNFNSFTFLFHLFIFNHRFKKSWHNEISLIYFILFNKLSYFIQFYFIYFSNF